MIDKRWAGGGAAHEGAVAVGLVAADADGADGVLPLEIDFVGGDGGGY